MVCINNSIKKKHARSYDETDPVFHHGDLVSATCGASMALGGELTDVNAKD
jgi:hypothetical protein